VETLVYQNNTCAIATGVSLLFPWGLLGFPDVHEYTLLDIAPDIPFKCLQAVHGPDLAFILMDPFMLEPDYQVAVNTQDLRDLDVQDPKHLGLLVILTIPQAAPNQATANLQGPILVNTENHRAKQIVLVQGAYHTRHPLLSLATAPA
jgi:flagellar assembly factor FliW